MRRRSFLKSFAAAAIVGTVGALPAFASVPKMKVTRVRAYLPPNPNPLFNQSDVVVTVETDAGIFGVGEGGAKDTLSQLSLIHISYGKSTEVLKRKNKRQ